LSLEAIEKAIELNGVAVGASKAAFHWGRRLAHDPKSIRELIADRDETRTLADMSLGDVIEHRKAHLMAYQNAALGDRYVSFVDEAKNAVKTAGISSDKVPFAVAVTYARVLAYKDEYEVARLLTDAAFEANLHEEMEGDIKLAFNLAPPMLAGRDPNGRPKKREFGPWILPVLRQLARLRILRGTVFDLFGYLSERKLERSLISEYEGIARRILARLNGDNELEALAILTLFDEIRGFGPVKEEAARKIMAQIAQRMEAYEKPKETSRMPHAA
jgi:indolepyruvate ferredoxin oxidoreductase